jgi:hypothetical protein
MHIEPRSCKINTAIGRFLRSPSYLSAALQNPMKAYRFSAQLLTKLHVMRKNRFRGHR